MSFDRSASLHFDSAEDRPMKLRCFSRAGAADASDWGASTGRRLLMAEAAAADRAAEA